MRAQSKISALPFWPAAGVDTPHRRLLGLGILGRGGIAGGRLRPFSFAARGEDISRIQFHGTLDSKLRGHRAVIGQMTAVHDVSMGIDRSVGYQLPFARVVTNDVGLRAGCPRHLKVRAVLVGKEAVEDMIALVRAGWRHVDALTGIAVEVAAHDPEQRDGTVTVELVERIEVALAILSGAVSRRGVEGDQQQLIVPVLATSNRTPLQGQWGLTPKTAGAFVV